MTASHMKDFLPALGIVQALIKCTSARVLSFDDQSCSWSVTIRRPRTKGFDVYLDAEERLTHDLGKPCSLILEMASHTLESKTAFLHARHFSLGQEGSSESYEFSLWSFNSAGRTEKASYWRIVIPLPSGAFHSRFHQVQFVSYRTTNRESLGRLPISFAKVSMDVVFHKEVELEYLIFDVQSMLSLNEALEQVHAVGLALGYVTGEFAQEECFCFHYSAQEMTASPLGFEYRMLRDSIRSSYAPICSNAYSYLSLKKEEAGRLNPLLRQLSVNEFNLLCERVASDAHFAAHLLLIQGSMAASVVAMPPGLCVALEGICKAPSSTKQAIDEHPAIDAWVAEHVPELKKSLNAVKDGKNDGRVSAMQGRLNDIAKPTNREQLEGPFKAIGYVLSSQESKAISSRNRFLHGDVLLGNKSDIDQASKDAYYMALRLYGLLAVLILKPTGYDNYLVNYAKLREEIHGTILEEDYYIKL